MDTPFNKFVANYAEEKEMLEKEVIKNKKTVKPWDILDPRTNWTIKEVSRARMDICNTCPQLIKFTKQCKQCGCFMAVKTMLEEAVCPLGKWV